MRNTTMAAPAIALAAALLIAGCGGSKSTSTTTDVTTKTGGTMGTGMKGAVSAADVHCASGDPVVWLNLKKKTIHEAGDPYYGKTKNGKYLCLSDAQSMGGHLSGSAKNGMSASGGKHRRHSRGAGAEDVPAATATP